MISFIIFVLYLCYIYIGWLFMTNKNAKREMRKEWKPPVINQMKVSLTKSAWGDYNTENKVHGGRASGAGSVT